VRSSTPFVALLASLWLAATCASQTEAPGAAADAGATELLTSACERALAGLAPDPEPPPAALPPELGPAARALHGTGMGARVIALETALERSTRLALADAKPWLETAAAKFEPERAKLADSDDALSAAFRSASERELREQLAPAAARHLEETGAPAALASVRDGASRLPLPRSIDLDLVSVVTDRAVRSFFDALAEQERRIRQERVALQGGR